MAAERDSFLGFIDVYKKADDKVASALGDRKDLRARIKGAGYSLKAFDRARKEAEKSAEDRVADDREFRRNMDWLGLPLFEASEDGAEAAPRSTANGSANGHATEEAPTRKRRRRRQEDGTLAF